MSASFALRVMKRPKKELALPRRTWRINPTTRVKESVKVYSRPRLKQQSKDDEQQ